MLAIALERDGGGAGRRTAEHRGVPSRRSRPGALPTLDPGGRRAQALDKGDLWRWRAAGEDPRSKQDTSDRVRALIRDLHRSPLGAKGLARPSSRSPRGGRDSGVQFHPDVRRRHVARTDRPADVSHRARGHDERPQAREANNFWITVREDEEIHRAAAPRQRRRVRHVAAGAGGALRDDDDARAGRRSVAERSTCRALPEREPRSRSSSRPPCWKKEQEPEPSERAGDGTPPERCFPRYIRDAARRRPRFSRTVHV